MNKNVMTIEQFVEFAGSTVFTVRFIKRTNGELRTMNARFGVKKHLKGGKLAFEPKNHNLLCVYDMQKQHVEGFEDKANYRMINLDALIDLQCRGNYYVWADKGFLQVSGAREVRAE